MKESKYQFENSKIILGDCLEKMSIIPDKSVHLICTDLPYGVTKNLKDIVIPFDKLWEQYNRIIKDNGAIVLFAQGLFYVDLVNSNRKMFRHDLVWDKKLPTGFLNAKRMPMRVHVKKAVHSKSIILSDAYHSFARVNQVVEKILLW